MLSVKMKRKKKKKKGVLGIVRAKGALGLFMRGHLGDYLGSAAALGSKVS